MAFFYIWETVDFPIQIHSEDGEQVLVDYKDIIISLSQNNVLIEKDTSSPDVAIDDENDIINMHLSQEETGQFKANKEVRIQVNILYNDEERDTTSEATIQALSNLHKEVME